MFGQRLSDSQQGVKQGNHRVAAAGQFVWPDFVSVENCACLREQECVANAFSLVFSALIASDGQDLAAIAGGIRTDDLAAMNFMGAGLASKKSFVGGYLLRLCMRSSFLAS